MDAAREAVAGLGIQLQGGHRAADVDEIPARALEQDGAGAFGHFAFLPAHHPCHRVRAGGVADQHGEWLQGALDPIQGDEFFTRQGLAGDDSGGLAAGALEQHVIIEGVQGLADFEHDIVGGIDDAVDRS